MSFTNIKQINSYFAATFCVSLLLLAAFGVLSGFCFYEFGKFKDHEQNLTEELIDLRRRVSAMEKSSAAVRSTVTANGIQELLEKIAAKCYVAETNETFSLTIEFEERRKSEAEEERNRSPICMISDHDNQIKKLPVLQARINELEKDLEEKTRRYKDDKQDQIRLLSYLESTLKQLTRQSRCERTTLKSEIVRLTARKEVQTNELKEKLSEAESELALLKSEATTSKTEINQLRSEAEGYKTELDSLRHDNSELEQSIDELDKDHELALEQLIKQRDELKQENTTLHTQLTDLSSNISTRDDNSEQVKTLRNDLERVTCTINELHQDKQQLEQDLKNNKAKLKLLADKYKDLSSKFKSAEEDLKITREELKLKNDTLENIHSQSIESSSRNSMDLENLTKELEQTQTRLAETSNQLTETRAQLEQVEETRDVIQANCQALSAQRDTTLISLNTVEGNYTASQEKITTLENEIEHVNSQLQSEITARKELQLEITSLLQLTESRDHEFKILHTKLEETKQHLTDSQENELLLKQEISALQEQVTSFTDSDSPRSTNHADGPSVSEDELRDQTGDTEPHIDSETPLEQQLTELKELLAQKVLLINELQSAADRAVSERSEDSELQTEAERESELERLQNELRLSEAEVEEMTRQAKDLEADIRVATDAQEQLMVKYEATVSEKEELSEKNLDLKTKLQSFQSNQEQTQLELTNERTKLESLTSQIVELKNQVNQFTEEAEKQLKQIKELVTENERLAAENRSSEQEMARLRSQLSSLSEEQSSHESARAAQHTMQMNELTNQSESLKKEIERLSNEIEDLTDDNKELTNQNEVYEEELSKMKSSLNVQTKEKNEIITRLESAETELGSLRSASQSEVDSHRELTERNSALNTRLREIEEQLQNAITEKNEQTLLVSQLETGSATLSEQLDSAEQEMNNLRSEKEVLESGIKESELRVKTAETRHEQTEKNLEQVTSELSESRSVIGKLEEEIRELRSGNEHLNEELSHQNTALTEFKNQVNLLENQMESLQLEVSSLTEEMEQKTNENTSLQNMLIQKDSEISAMELDMKNRVSAPPLLANPAESRGVRESVASGVDDVADFEGMTDELKTMKREIEDKDRLIKELTEKNKTLQHTVGVYGDLHQLQEQVKSISQDRDKLITVLNEKTQENSELKQEVRNLNDRLATNHTLHDETEGDVTSERSEMNKEAIQKLSALVQDREMQIEALKQKNESLLEILQNMGQTETPGLKTAGEDNSLLIKERDDLLIRVEQISAERNQIYTALQQKHQEAVNYHSEAVRLTQLVQTLQDSQKNQTSTPIENGTSTDDHHEHAEELMKVVEENKKLKLELSSLRSELTHVNTHSQEKIEVNNLQEKTASSNENSESMEQLNNQIADLESRIIRLTSERDQAGSTLSTITRTNTELKEQNSRLTNDLQQYNNQLQLLLQERQRIAVDIQTSNAEKLSLQAQCDKLNKEVERLRAHLLTVEQNQTEEMLVYEEREKELRDRLAAAEHQAISSNELVGQARNEQSQYISTLTNQLGTVVRERDDLTRKLSQSESESRQLSTELENLQLVLEQIQQEHDSIHAAEVASLQQQLTDSKFELSSLRLEVQKLNARLEEQRETVEAAGRISEQLDKKDQVIDMLQAEVEQRETQIRDSEAEIRKLNQTNELRVEKQLVRNLFLNYFSAPRSKQPEVLSLISRFLSFSEEDNQKIGLHTQGWVSGILSRFTSSAGGSSPAHQADLDKSFSEMFVKFLEAESAPKSKPLPLPVDKLVADRPQAGHSEKRKSLSESTYNPFIAPTSTNSIPVSLGQRSNTGLVGGASQQAHPLIVGMSSSGMQTLRQSSPLLSLSKPTSTVSITTTQQTSLTSSVPSLLTQPNIQSTFRPIVTPTSTQHS